MGEIGIAEELRALGAQTDHFGDIFLVVGRPAIVAPHDEAAEHFLPQIASGGELQERLGARTRQRHDITVELALLRVGLHRLAHEAGQAGKLRLFAQAAA